MPVDVFECHWRCRACQHKNLGRDEKCFSCGKVKDDKDEEIMAEDLGPGYGVKDPELLKKFTAGADWVCRYCKGHERNTKGECSNCGGGKKEGTSRDSAETEYLKRKSALSPEPPLIGGSYRRAPKREKPDAWPPQVIDRSGGKKREEPVDDAVRRFTVNTKPAKVVLALVGAFLFGVLLFFLLRPRIYDATVGSVQWTHTVIVDRYAVYTDEGFEEKRPGSAFDIEDRGRRVHHHDHVVDHYETRRHTRQVTCGQDCRTTQNCTTTPRHCSSNKNGSMTCSGGDRVCSPQTSCTTRYCSEPYTTEEAVYRDDPVYRPWYSWKNWEWHENRRVIETGATTETFWPNPEKIGLDRDLSDGERERSRQEARYTVNFTADKGEYSYEPVGLAEFQKFGVGSKHRIKVTLGSVAVLAPGQR